jgi:hypothetical protein
MPISGNPLPAIFLRCPQCRGRVVLEDRLRLDLNDDAVCHACGRTGKVVEFVNPRTREPDQHGG